MNVYRYNGRPLWAPGAYVGVPSEAYHGGALCAGRSLSGSQIVKALRSPRHFWTYSPWNPAREEKPRSDALEFGKAAHMQVFEPDLFVEQVVVSPHDDFRTKEAKLWREAALADGKIVLRPDDMATVDRMAAAIRAEPDAVALFKDGLPELTYVCKDEATGLWLQTRPDFVPASLARGPSDYKTTANAEPEAFSRDLFKLGYHVKAALALHVLEQVEGERRPTYWYAAQEKEPPYVVTVLQHDGEQLELGARLLRQTLDRIARCLDVHDRGEPGAWPAYTDGAAYVVTPYQTRKDIEAMRTAA